MSKKKYTFIDLFAGCGGLSLGFEMAGFESILAIDNWKDALTTYAYNRKGARTLCGDLATLDPYKIKQEYNISDVDVIIGGPPCQGFSIAGKRIVDDERNSLYKAFVKMVACFKPKAFLLENVPNILSLGDGVIRDAIVRDFENLGYTISYKVLLAADYGVPQNRRRAIFIGFLNGHVFEFPRPTVTTPITSKEAISDLPENSIKEGGQYTSAPQSEFQKMMRQGSSVVYNHEVTVHNERTKEIIAMVPDGGNYKNLPIELQNTRKVHIAWTRLNSTRPSMTIDTGHFHHFHYEYNRVPTARESARIQSFPDTFVFLGNKTSKLKQIGNAVPPLMAKAIAEQIGKQIK